MTFYLLLTSLAQGLSLVVISFVSQESAGHSGMYSAGWPDDPQLGHEVKLDPDIFLAKGIFSRV